jgi:transcriptional regulator with XRE-family HTH domain
VIYRIRYRMALRKRMVANLKGLRKRRDLTQEHLAQKAGISRTYLARIELGQHDPTLSVLEKLARALGVPVTKLLE